jgi:hypothetical protein
LSGARGESRYDPYREAIRLRVCAICLDGADNGSCTLTSVCAVDELLPRLVDTILDERSRRDDGYSAAIEARVCAHCRHRDERGFCALRRDGRCAVSVYLPLLIEAVEEVERRQSRRPA